MYRADQVNLIGFFVIYYDELTYTDNIRQIVSFQFF